MPARPAAADPRTADAAARLTATFPMVNDHPDVAGVLRDPELLRLVGATLAAPFADADVTLVCAPEARGPVVGALVARELGAGLVLARKDDRNHPGADLTVTSEPTWRGAPERFQLRSFDFRPGERVLVVDDWITTGSSVAAVRDVVAGCGAFYLGASVLVNKSAPSTLDDLDVAWVVSFDDLGGPPRR